MKRIKRRIISGSVTVCCAALGLTALATVPDRKTETVPASVLKGRKETPVIILDAGHGGSN